MRVARCINADDIEGLTKGKDYILLSDFMDLEEQYFRIMNDKGIVLNYLGCRFIEFHMVKPKPKTEVYWIDDNTKVVHSPPLTIIVHKDAKGKKHTVRAKCHPETIYNKWKGYETANDMLKDVLGKKGKKPRKDHDEKWLKENKNEDA